MNPNLLKYLCEPVAKESLHLVDAVADSDGLIKSGKLVKRSGNECPIVDGMLRFIDFIPTKTAEFFVANGTALISLTLRVIGFPILYPTPSTSLLGCFVDGNKILEVRKCVA